MDPSLAGTLVFGAAFAPWAIEVGWQVRLQARFVAALPARVRGALPRHPARPWLAFLAPARFHLACWRYVRRDLPDDPDVVSRLKRQIRASLRRVTVWGLGAVGVFLTLLATGWRPIVP
jgi:hypothetical protein